MKKNNRIFLVAIVSILIGLLALIFTVFTNIIVISGDKMWPFSAIVILVILYGFISFGLWLADAKPNYDFENLKEGQAFKIISINETDGGFSGKMVVVVHGFGETLMFLSPKLEDWPQKKIPMKDKTYMKKGDRLIEICL